MSALAKKSVVIRSDHIVARMGDRKVPTAKGAPAVPPTPKSGKLEVHDFYVDYILQARDEEKKGKSHRIECAAPTAGQTSLAFDV
jgi:hypothetical protein